MLFSLSLSLPNTIIRKLVDLLKKFKTEKFIQFFFLMVFTLVIVIDEKKTFNFVT